MKKNPDFVNELFPVQDESHLFTRVPDEIRQELVSLLTELMVSSLRTPKKAQERRMAVHE